MKLIRVAVMFPSQWNIFHNGEFGYTFFCFCSDGAWIAMSALHCATEYTKSRKKGRRRQEIDFLSMHTVLAWH
jgi:hypothetical protein